MAKGLGNATARLKLAVANNSDFTVKMQAKFPFLTSDNISAMQRQVASIMFTTSDNDT